MSAFTIAMMFNPSANLMRMPVVLSRAIALLAVPATVAVATSLACNSSESGTSDYVIPSPTPGTISGEFTPKVTDTAGTLSVELFVGYEGYTQQGTVVLEESDTGTNIQISVRPAPGIVQLANLREGTCDEIGRWLESVEHAIGGESNSHLPDYALGDLFDGNHVITLSIPGGGINDVSTCGQLPEIDIESLR